MASADTGFNKVRDALDRHTYEITDNGVFRNKELRTQAVMLGCVVGELSRIADSLEKLTLRMEDPKDPSTWEV